MYRYTHLIVRLQTLLVHNGEPPPIRRTRSINPNISRRDLLDRLYLLADPLLPRKLRTASEKPHMAVRSPYAVGSACNREPLVELVLLTGVGCTRRSIQSVEGTRRLVDLLDVELVHVSASEYVADRSEYVTDCKRMHAVKWP